VKRPTEDRADGSASGRIHVVTDIELTGVPGSDVSIDRLLGDPPRGSRAWFRRTSHADVLVFRLPEKRTSVLFTLAKWRSRGRRLVYYDLNVPMVERAWDAAKREVFFRLLRGADLILTLQADTAEYARLTGIPRERFRYVGFKSNAWEDAESVARGRATEDQGTYVLACGRSYRDFRTFAEAIEIAGVPGRILMTQGDVRAEGSTVPDRIPSNLEIVPHDGTRAGWVDAILGAKVVTVPIREGVHQPAGISVYLESMNLSRPVVVTEGASTRGMLHDRTAGIPPAGDARAMAREIRRLWDDARLRGSRIRAGREYVATLGGIERISKAILAEALSLFEESPKPSRAEAA
jgi:hypothetical protein